MDTEGRECVWIVGEGNNNIQKNNMNFGSKTIITTLPLHNKLANPKSSYPKTPGIKKTKEPQQISHENGNTKTPNTTITKINNIISAGGKQKKVKTSQEKSGITRYHPHPHQAFSKTKQMRQTSRANNIINTTVKNSKKTIGNIISSKKTHRISRIVQKKTQPQGINVNKRKEGESGKTTEVNKPRKRRKQSSQHRPLPKHFCQQIKSFCFKKSREPMKLRAGLNGMI